MSHWIQWNSESVLTDGDGPTQPNPGASDAYAWNVDLNLSTWGPNAIGKGDLTLSEMGTFGSRNGESNGQH